MYKRNALSWNRNKRNLYFLRLESIGIIYLRISAFISVFAGFYPHLGTCQLSSAVLRQSWITYGWQQTLTFLHDNRELCLLFAQHIKVSTKIGFFSKLQVFPTYYTKFCASVSLSSPLFSLRIILRGYRDIYIFYLPAKKVLWLQPGRDTPPPQVASVYAEKRLV